MLVQLNFNIKMTKILCYWYLLFDSFRSCETYFATHPQFVANKSAISPFLGGGLYCQKFDAVFESLFSTLKNAL